MEQQLIVDRYRPLEMLGEGGYGTVVSAWDTRMQRRVAIKRLPLPRDERGMPHQPHGLAEARTAAMLAHPGIVTVYDFDTDSDEAFIVMEYVDGLSLGDLLGALDGSLTLDETATVISSIAAALEFAHDNGVLHLDMKPDNVLIDRDGRVKVVDFGMAELSSLSGHGPAWGGTLGYMPLEQLEGTRVSERTDEWALAVLAYECLTGDNPFVEPTVESAVMNLEVFDPPPPSASEPELAAAVDEVIMAGLGPRPAERYETVAQFAAALMPHLGDAETGRELLAELVSTYAGEPEYDGESLERLGLWDRLRGRGGSALLRVLAVGQAGLLAWTGLQPWALDPAAAAGAAALVALAAALAPSLGIGLGMLAFAFGFTATGAWPVAVGLGAAIVVWWWYVARHSDGAAVLPVSAPVLGLIGLAAAVPLIAGFALRPARAAASGLAAGVLLMLASAASVQSAPYLTVLPAYALDVWEIELARAGVRTLLTDPSSLVALASWPAAAAIMSLACHWSSRLSALAGAVMGAAVLGGGYVLANEIAGTRGVLGAWTDGSVTFSVTASLILVLLVVVLGPPIRAEEDDA